MSNPNWVDLLAPRITMIVGANRLGCDVSWNPSREAMQVDLVRWRSVDILWGLTCSFEEPAGRFLIEKKWLFNDEFDRIDRITVEACVFASIYGQLAMEMIP